MKKFDSTVKELKEDIAQLEKDFGKVSEDLDEAGKIKANEIVKKTENVINTSIDKVSAALETIQDEEQLNDLLDKIKAKAKEATDYALEKIEAIANGDDNEIDKLHDDIMAEFDKLKETDIYKTTTVLIKQSYDKVNEFLARPDVQDAITKAKKTTIKVAEKGVEGLKRVLDTDKKPAKKTTTKKVATKKTTTKKAPAKKAKATTKKTTKKAA